MVNESERGALALCGHQQGRERQFGPHVIPHCPAHDLARREIKDGCQIEPAIAGRNVCDICQPYPARRRCEEPLREQVWGDREGVTTVGRARAKTSARQSADIVTAHHSLDAPATIAVALRAQCRVHPGTAVSTMMLCLEPMHLGQQVPVTGCPRALRPRPPSIEATR
jgi:hypothetical protein